MIVISHVVALSNNNVIGVNNDLPWNLKKDLAHFKEYTTNKIIIMGRKTFESIGRPLPNRINFVVSKTIKDIEGAHFFTSTKDFGIFFDKCPNLVPFPPQSITTFIYPKYIINFYI